MPLPKMPPKRASSGSQFSLTTKFKGYSAKEDQTYLDPSVLVSPSQNVRIGTSGRLALVAGYTVDGVASTVIDSGILSSFDFANFKGDVRNMRAGFLTAAGNDGKLQYRYVTGAGTIASPYVTNWVDLKTALTTVRLSFASYWDNTALARLCLWVDSSNNIYAWNGAVTTLASATVNTVTKQDSTKTWSQEGFSTTGSIVINGVPATYTGGSATTTLTGVSVDFSSIGTYPVGSITHQQVITTALSAMTAILATFSPYIIACGNRNQVYLGSATSNNIYISKVNNYLDYTFTAPVRVVGEGALIPLENVPRGFLARQSQSSETAEDIWISEGLSTWGIIRASLSSDLTKETLQHMRVKTTALLGAKSERLMGAMKNHIMFVANDGTANLLGYLSINIVPTIVDFSYPIANDVASYDFTDGSIFYHRNYIYIAIPKHGLIRVYNMTDQTSEQFSGSRAIEDITQQPWFWEAPIKYPISSFYTVNGELYGHSYTTSESYKLFTGGSFNGQQIDAVATFAPDDRNFKSESKGSDRIWVSGYIKQNTVLNVDVARDFGGDRLSQNVTVDGSDTTIVSSGSSGNSLGDSGLGKQTLGGSTTIVASGALPAWFQVIKTYPEGPFYYEQITFSTKGVDLQWELLGFGTNAELTAEDNNAITQ